VEQRVVRFLAQLTMMQEFALLYEVSRFETIHAKPICLQRTDFLVVRQMLELLTGVKWVFLHLAYNTIGREI
jgi:hypothetical protein